jgi:hypothetical protein
MAVDDAYWKVTVGEIGGSRRRAVYEVYTNTQGKAEASAEKRARAEYGGRWIALLVKGPQGGPF